MNLAMAQIVMLLRNRLNKLNMLKQTVLKPAFIKPSGFAWLCATFLMLGVSACSLAAPSKEEGALKIELSINEDQLPAGLVVMQSHMVNHTGQTITLLPWNTPFDSAITGRFLKVTEKSAGDTDVELAYMGPMVKRSAPVASDYVTVGNGEELQNRLDITKVYNFCQNHSYSVTFENNLFGVDYQIIPVDSSSIQFITGSRFPACDK